MDEVMLRGMIPLKPWNLVEGFVERSQGAFRAYVFTGTTRTASVLTSGQSNGNQMTWLMDEAKSGGTFRKSLPAVTDIPSTKYEKALACANTVTSLHPDLLSRERERESSSAIREVGLVCQIMLQAQD